MKKSILFLSLALFCSVAFAQVEYKVVTSVESIVPGGLGRSRIISENEKVDYTQFTTERTDGKKSDQGDVKRKEVKIENFEETKLLNFYSLTGINFQNIASNDAMISDKINRLAAEGWRLVFVTSAAEADAGKDDGTGIYITRYIFQR
jgi:hypothetical protein